MKKIMLIVTVLALSCLIVAGCSKSGSQMVGKWVGSTGSFEFFKDKTGVITPAQTKPDMPASANFRWAMEGSDEVRIYLPTGMKKTVFGKLKGKNVLIIEDDRFVKQ